MKGAIKCCFLVGWDSAKKNISNFYWKCFPIILKYQYFSHNFILNLTSSKFPLRTEQQVSLIVSRLMSVSNYFHGHGWWDINWKDPPYNSCLSTSLTPSQIINLVRIPVPTLHTTFRLRYSNYLLKTIVSKVVFFFSYNLVPNLLTWAWMMR